MEELVGKVLEVYIPSLNSDGKITDVLINDMIGFKVLVNNEEINLEVVQNDENVEIMKDDDVIIIKQVISGKEFIDIKLNI